MKLFFVGLIFWASANANMQLSIPASVVQSGTTLADMNAVIRLYNGTTYPQTSVGGPSGLPLNYHFYFSYDGIIPNGTLVQNTTITICGGSQTRTLPFSGRTYYDGPQFPVDITGLVAFPSCSQPTPPMISNINYTPAQPNSNDDVSVSANVTDDGQVMSVLLFYNVNGGSFNSLVMNLGVPPAYVGTIPDQNSGDIVAFYIMATDNQSNSSTSNTITYSVSSPTLELLTPMNEALVSDFDISFSWEDINADRYLLVVDDDPDFSSPEISPISPNFADLFNPSIELNANWIPSDTWYWKVTAIMSDDSEVESSVFSFNYDPPVASQPNWHPWYRLFSETRRDHFYCSNETHSDAAQILGYREEGVEGHLVAFPFDHPNAEPIYRFWWGSSEVGGHYYTTGEVRREAAIQSGMTYEGITGYGLNAPQPGLIPLYYLQKVYADGSGRIDNFYTVSAIERQNAVVAHGFVDVDVLAYISLSGDMGPMPWSPWSLLTGMGISTDNGNLKHHETTDFELPGAGPALRFSHQYNSLAVYYPDALKSLGPGWSHDYSSCIVESGGQLFVCWSDGSVHVYDAASAECLVDGVYDEMTIESDTRIEIKNKAQMRFAFERPAADYPYLLREIRDRNSNTLSCQYEASSLHRLTSVADANGRSLTLAYHTTEGLESYIQSVTDPMGRQISFSHDLDTGDLTSYTDPEGHVSTYGYNVLLPHEHQLKTITLPDGTVIDNTYEDRKVNYQHWSNQIGGMSLEYDGNTTTVSYLGTQRTQTVSYLPSDDELQPRRTSARSEGANPATVFNYDNPQHPTLPSSMQDPRGNYHYFFYDARGNIIEESHPLGSNYQYAYDEFNNVISVEDPLSHTTTYGYDGNGNLTSITQPGGHVTTLAREARGLASSISNYAGTTSFAYNAQGNLITVTDALSHQSHFTVDLVGRVTAVTDANGASTQYSVDDRGLVTQVVDALGGVMNVSYDANGQITATNGPGASHTAWGYTDGFLTSYQTPGCPTTYAYNPDGSLASRTRPLGTTHYSYDNAGRLSGIQGASNATIARDASGNITAVDDSNCDLAFTYDALNRVTSTTDCWGNVISYGYDAKGNTTAIVYGPGKTVHYTYDSDDRMQTVTDWNGRVISYNYRPDGLFSSIIYPNGVNSIYDYDVTGRQTEITHNGPLGVIASYDYVYDAVGNITGKSSLEPLISPDIPASTTNYSYNGSAQLVSDGMTSYSYDGNGNLSSASGQRNLSMQFDEENRLVAYTGSLICQFSYDTFGRRIQEIKDGIIARYSYGMLNSQERLIELNGANDPIRYYIYGYGLEASLEGNSATSYYHGNNIGNVVATTDENGSILYSYIYDSFGEVLDSNDSSQNRQTFIGKFGATREGDGLYTMGNRMYDSKTGRFLSIDPVWSANLYHYANNSPISYFDPIGSESITPYKWFKSFFEPKHISAIDVTNEVREVAYKVAYTSIEELSKDHVSIRQAVDQFGETAMNSTYDYENAATYVNNHAGINGILEYIWYCFTPEREKYQKELIEEILRIRYPNYWE